VTAQAGPGEDGPTGGGLIGLFARHPTAANLLMVLMVVSGLFSVQKLNRQFFPNFAIDIITISVAWPGASAEDVDNTIIQAIEPEVRYLDGVDQVSATSFEGLGQISIEFVSGADMQKALAEVESAVDQVSTLPEESEAPKIRRIISYERVSRIVLSGPFPEQTLKTIAKKMRNDLLARGIDKINMTGARDEEIWVEIQPETLRRMDLTLTEVARKISDSNRDVPAGTLAGGERQVRSLGLKLEARELEAVEVKALPDGTRVRLGDIAALSDTFEEGGTTLRRLGNTAIELQVRRAQTADSLTSAKIVSDYLEEVGPTYPDTLRIEQFNIRADRIRERIDLLLKNGASGLALVLLMLFLFLNARIAFWVAIGIPISMTATLAAMYVTGQSINMISLFGMIMALGIVVDDAIVVGEHADTMASRGLRPRDAAIAGAMRMAAPVSSSTLTTIAAFLPLFVMSGRIGDIISAIPFVIVTILIASLMECFLVLPTHMRHALRGKRDHRPTRFRAAFDAGFAYFRDRMFRAAAALCIRYRYATVAAAIAGLLMATGLMAGGRLGFQFFPNPESDSILANVEMVAGSTRSETIAALDQIEAALFVAAQDLIASKDGDSRPASADELIEMSLILVGSDLSRGTSRASSTDTIGGVRVELLTADQRDIRTKELIRAWRHAVPPIAGLKNFAIRRSHGGPPGRDVDIRLIGGNARELKAAAAEIQAQLTRFPGVTDIEDNLPYGKPETILEVSPRGQSLGFSTASVAQQVRGALNGAIAQRFARDDEEITVRVLYPREAVGIDVLDSLYLRSPTGAEVPLAEIVTQRNSIGFARIRREDGLRQLSVTGEIDYNVASLGELIDSLAAPNTSVEGGSNVSILDSILDKYSISYQFKGRAEEHDKSFSDMQYGAGLALIAIYIILAWVFGSYTRPIPILLTIPLGIIGAFLGHYLLGYKITILALIAMIGLSGIVINDSIVLISTIDERLKKQPYLEAILDGTCDRLRAVMLTSLTTIGGLTPLIFETSLQAQFLIPMAITIVFGLAIATFLILLVIPALVAIQGDIAWLFRKTPGPGPELAGGTARAPIASGAGVSDITPSAPG